MYETFDIAGYCRISVDEEKDEENNVSIENQKAIIADFVNRQFPNSCLHFFEDRDRSGYTFEQREGYQEMRRGLMSHKYEILVVKDFSRFSRRNSRGLVELEDLRDSGIRIISIGDGIDFPNDDDWLKIQFQFLINEMPVTDTSKKVRNVIKRRQQDGRWICAAPYGYIINETQKFEVVSAEADVVRKIFDLYNNGWGYRRIANYLTCERIPTPRMSEQLRKEAKGKLYQREVKSAWSIITIQEILDNDFYIGTLRQGKYTRAKINGKDIKRDESDVIVIENHHQPIIDRRTFCVTRALRESRTTSNYRGIKKNDNIYSGFLVCGDCGSPMFSMSRRDLVPAYTCGTYHRRGLSGCTAHHLRVDKLDELLKHYLCKVYENTESTVIQINTVYAEETDSTGEAAQSADHLIGILDNLKEELRITKRQRIRDIMKKPEQEALLDETYDQMEVDLQKTIETVQNQIFLLSDKQSTVAHVNRVAENILGIFRSTLEKDKLERSDLELLIRKISVFEDHLEIELHQDINTLLHISVDGNTINYDPDAETAPVTLIQTSKNHSKRVYHVNVISDGDPLEIYTDREGEVIFKKYSPLSELVDFAGQYAESLYKTCNFPVAVCDRDSVVAAAGVSKKEFLDKKISRGTDLLIEGRNLYSAQNGSDSERIPLTEDERSGMYLVCAMPIFTEGDVIGCVAAISPDETFRARTEKGEIETEIKLIRTAAAFLGRQLEG